MNNDNNNVGNVISLVGNEPSKEVIAEKLLDAQIPGFIAEFDPDEAEQVGAFTEDALSEQDALESDIDWVDLG